MKRTSNDILIPFFVEASTWIQLDTSVSLINISLSQLNSTMIKTKVMIRLNKKICFGFISLQNKWIIYITIGRSSHQRCSIIKGVLRNFAKFTGKHLCQSLFFNKVVGPRPSLWNSCQNKFNNRTNSARKQDDLAA